MTETEDPKLIDIYTDYINNDELDIYKPSGKVKVSKDMGYVSTVNDARDMLEKLYKEDIETKDKPDI